MASKGGRNTRNQRNAVNPPAPPPREVAVIPSQTTSPPSDQGDGYNPATPLAHPMRKLPGEMNEDELKENRMKKLGVVFNKTRLCRHNMMGACEFGDSCTFAHHESELTQRLNLEKTKICTSLTQHVPCKFGAQCNFAHNVDELRFTRPNYKIDPCENFAGGHCRYGDICNRAHGPVELAMFREVANRAEQKGEYSNTSTVTTFKSIMLHENIDEEEWSDEEDFTSEDPSWMKSLNKKVATMAEDTKSGNYSSDRSSSLSKVSGKVPDTSPKKTLGNQKFMVDEQEC